MSDAEESQDERDPSEREAEEPGSEDEVAGEPVAEVREEETDGSDSDSEPAPEAIPLAEPAPAEPPEIYSVTDTGSERQQRVREKLREMYGDDSAETVRRFLYDLTTDGEDEPSN